MRRDFFWMPMPKKEQNDLIKERYLYMSFFNPNIVSNCDDVEVEFSKENGSYVELTGSLYSHEHPRFTPATVCRFNVGDLSEMLSVSANISLKNSSCIINRLTYKLTESEYYHAKPVQ